MAEALWGRILSGGAAQSTATPAARQGSRAERAPRAPRQPRQPRQRGAWRTSSTANVSAAPPSAVAPVPQDLRLDRLSGVPDFKLVPGCSPPVLVDGFKYARRIRQEHGASVFFLSHFHSDHYTGLTKALTSEGGRVYCSTVTARLVRLQFRLPEEAVVALPLFRRCPVPGNETGRLWVTLVPANHCPGAVLLLFERQGGPSWLHVGDFRWHPRGFRGWLQPQPPPLPALGSEDEFVQPQPRSPEQLQTLARLRSLAVDGVFLDTTYCDPKHVFPEQAESVRYVLREVSRCLSEDKMARLAQEDRLRQGKPLVSALDRSQTLLSFCSPSATPTVTSLTPMSSVSEPGKTGLELDLLADTDVDEEAINEDNEIDLAAIMPLRAQSELACDSSASRLPFPVLQPSSPPPSKRQKLDHSSSQAELLERPLSPGVPVRLATAAAIQPLTLFLVGAYAVGKERIALALRAAYPELGPIMVSPDRLRRLRCMSDLLLHCPWALDEAGQEPSAAGSAQPASCRHQDEETKLQEEAPEDQFMDPLLADSLGDLLQEELLSEFTELPADLQVAEPPPQAVADPEAIISIAAELEAEQTELARWEVAVGRVFTTQAVHSRLHVVSMRKLNQQAALEYAIQQRFQDPSSQMLLPYSRLVVFRPTGWTGPRPSVSVKVLRFNRDASSPPPGQPGKQEAQRLTRSDSSGASDPKPRGRQLKDSQLTLEAHSVPYSEHSSWTELRDCVELLCQKGLRRVVPTVNTQQSDQQAALFADLLLRGPGPRDRPSAQ